MRSGTAIAILALTLSLAPRPASADWPTLARRITANPNDQLNPRIATDGAAGAIIVWQDFRSTRVNIFARRVLASGNLDPAWPIDGRALLTDSTALTAAITGQQFPVIAPDGAGGAIIAWQDGRSLATGLDIFAQHVLASGVVDPAWPANGRALCTATGEQDIPTIVSDGAGGAIVTWMDGRSNVTNVDIFAQHVLASGVVDSRWPVNGVPLSTAPAPQAFPKIASDGSGGAIVTWYDFRPSATSLDIYAQHVVASGIVDPVWPVNGRALCLAPGAQVDPAIVSDGQHGAIVTWEDPRDGPNHIFAQRVLGSSAIATGWPVNGRAVVTVPLEQIRPQIASDGASGAIVTWLDARTSNHNPYAHHVLASGVLDPAWPIDGRALSLSQGESVKSAIVEDGAGGAIVAWDETSFIFANHVLATGQLDPTFPVNGRFLRLLLTFQHNPDLVRSGTRDAIATWDDHDSSQDSDIYAMIVASGSGVDVDPGILVPEIAFATPTPNPATESVTLNFELPRPAAVRLAIYDIRGRRLRELVFGARPAGVHRVAWDLRDERGQSVGAGLSFARLEVNGRTFTQRIITLR